LKVIAHKDGQVGLIRHTPMAREHHLPLFHPRLVRNRIAGLDRSLFATHKKTIDVWLDHLRAGDVDGGEFPSKSDGRPA
jgi:hypothetical protein